MFIATVLLAVATVATGDVALPFLTGGVPATLGQYPAQVGVHVGQAIFCGGTIVNQNHVVTAAGCVLDNANNLVATAQVTIRSGVIMIDATTALMPVNRIFVHQHYNPWTFENDIAVLRTTNNFVFPPTALPNIAPATVNHRVVAERTVCQVVGWNWQQGVVNIPLQVMAVPVYERATCNTMHQGLIRESMLCTTYNAPTNGVCAPNRGGGLYCHGELTGVISFGFGCGGNQSSTVHTQVRYYEPWLQQQFGRQDTPPAGPTPMPGTGQGGGAPRSGVRMSVPVLLLLVIATLVAMLPH